MGHDLTKRLWGELSSLDRVQGSKGLLEAADLVAEVAQELGLLTHVKTYVYDGYTTALGLNMPIGWELRGGYCEMLQPKKKLLSSTDEHTLAVVTHSPPGDIEAPLVEPDSDWSNVKGHIVLTDEEPLYCLHKASEKGAVGIVWYKDRDINAYSYRGLFLDARHLSYLKRIPVVQVKPSVARELKKEMRKSEVVLHVRVDSEFGPQDMPVVEAVMNPNADRFVVLSAHYCHAGPGANDNASGAAGLIHAARKLLAQPLKNFGVIFLWVPEHYGTALWLSENRKPLEANINLDMIAASQVMSNSVITLHHNPWSSLHPVDGYLWFHLNQLARESSSSLRLDEAGFVLGSDHAPFVLLGTPGVMPITWPDRYYHSSEDYLDKTDWNVFELIVEAAGRSIATLDVGQPNIVRGWAYHYWGRQTMENVEAANMLAHFLKERLGIAVETPWVPSRNPQPLPVVMPLQDKHSPTYFKIRELKERVPHLEEAMAEAMILSHSMTFDDACKVAQTEFGIAEAETLREALVEFS
ncbi:DUF4910 domain-containing protein [Coprothermobacteraceae bacterium]|nr:DUF4910 domain-containing protein [Coprothermobacteraceae bacterium]